MRFAIFDYRLQIRGATEVLHEVETDGADTRCMKSLQFGLRNGDFDHRHPAAVGRVARDRVEQRAIVAAVHARLHQHRTRYSEMSVQRGKLRRRRVRRCVAASRRIGESSGGPEHMAMRIARARRHREGGFARIGVRRGNRLHRKAHSACTCLRQSDSCLRSAGLFRRSMVPRQVRTFLAGNRIQRARRIARLLEILERSGRASRHRCAGWKRPPPRRAFPA